MTLLNPLKKGLLLYGDASQEPRSAAALVEYGNAYQEAGRPNDALDFYSQAGYEEGIEEIARGAQQEGDYFLFHRAAVLTGKEPETGDLKALAENALKKGWLVFARQAFEAAGDKKGIKRVEGELDTAGFVPKEAPSES